jgi:hypothetical protein
MHPADLPSDRTPSGHPDEETLELYALGRLPDSQADQIEEHLLVCHPCQDALNELDDYVRAMKGALREHEVEKAVPKPSFFDIFRQSKALPAAAVGVAALGLAAVVVNRAGRAPDPVELTLRSVRGGGPAMAEAPAGAPLRLRLQSEQLKLDPSYRVKLVDAKGGELWSGAAPADGDLLRVDKALDSGMYWVRLYDASGAQVQEYGLQVK